MGRSDAVELRRGFALMTNPCASRSVAVQDAHVKVTNCGRYVASNASSRPYVFCSKRGGQIAAKSFHTLISRLGERAGIESLLLSGNRSQVFRNATDHPPRLTRVRLFHTMKVSGGTEMRLGVACRLRLFSRDEPLSRIRSL